jgi:hypothetical protein
MSVHDASFYINRTRRVAKVGGRGGVGTRLARMQCVPAGGGDEGESVLPEGIARRRAMRSRR